VFSSVLKQDDKMYKCDAYNHVVRQTTGGSYHRLVVQQGRPTINDCMAIAAQRSLLAAENSVFIAGLGSKLSRS